MRQILDVVLPKFLEEISLSFGRFYQVTFWVGLMFNPCVKKSSSQSAFFKVDYFATLLMWLKWNILFEHQNRKSFLASWKCPKMSAIKFPSGYTHICHEMLGILRWCSFPFRIKVDLGFIAWLGMFSLINVLKMQYSFKLDLLLIETSC